MLQIFNLPPSTFFDSVIAFCLNLPQLLAYYLDDTVITKPVQMINPIPAINNINHKVGLILKISLLKSDILSQSSLTNKQTLEKPKPYLNISDDIYILNCLATTAEI